MTAGGQMLLGWADHDGVPTPVELFAGARALAGSVAVGDAGMAWYPKDPCD